MSPKLVLGVNPIVGVDHFSSDRAREKLRSNNDTRAIEVIREAISGGAKGFSFSPGSRMLGILRKLRDEGEDSEIELFPVLPALEKYWPSFVSKGTYGLISAILEDLSFTSKAVTLIRGGAAAMARDPMKAIALYTSVELAKIQNNAPKSWRIDTVFLGETFTDAILSLGALDLIQAFMKSVERSRNIRCGLQTRNLPMLLQRSSDLENGHLPTIMAPLNRLGFQMTPDRKTCEDALEAHSQFKLSAISVLAAGQVSLQDAATYIHKWRNRLESVVIGTSNPNHAKETFSYFNNCLSK